MAGLPFYVEPWRRAADFESRWQAQRKLGDYKALEQPRLHWTNRARWVRHRNAGGRFFAALVDRVNKDGGHIERSDSCCVVDSPSLEVLDPASDGWRVARPFVTRDEDAPVAGFEAELHPVALFFERAAEEVTLRNPFGENRPANDERFTPGARGADRRVLIHGGLAASAEDAESEGAERAGPFRRRALPDGRRQVRDRRRGGSLLSREVLRDDRDLDRSERDAVEAAGQVELARRSRSD